MALALTRRLSGELVDDVAIAAGITASRPSGRQPCETTVMTGSPETTAPTAPSACTASSRMSACVPGRRPPAAIPPTSGVRSRASFSLVRNGPTGNVKGSTSSATSPGS